MTKMNLDFKRKPEVFRKLAQVKYMLGAKNYVETIERLIAIAEHYKINKELADEIAGAKKIVSEAE